MGTLEKVRNMFKVNSKTPEWCQMRRSVVFIVTLNIFHNSGILIVDFEQVNVKWVVFLVTFLPPYYTKEYSFIQLTLLKVIAIQILSMIWWTIFNSTNSFDDLMDYFQQLMDYFQQHKFFRWFDGLFLGKKSRSFQDMNNYLKVFVSS